MTLSIISQFWSQKSILAFMISFAFWPTGVISAAEKSSLKSNQVPGHQPVQPGEHPRLLFRKADLPEIKRRAQTPLGKQLVARLRATLGGGDAMPGHLNPKKIAYQGDPNLPEGAYTVSHAAGFGMLYQLTGEQKYADLGRQCLELGLGGQRDRDSRYAMNMATEEMRLGPSLGWTAVGYDLLYDGLDPAFREKIARFIQDYEGDALDGRPGALNKFKKSGKWELLTMEKTALKPPMHPGSNHFGPINGGLGLALLGIYGDPGTDTGKIDRYLERLTINAKRSLSAFGYRGFFHEGQGPANTAAYPALLSFFQALKNVKGVDYITPNEKMHWVSLRHIGESTRSAQGVPVYPVRHQMMGRPYGSEDMTPPGVFSANGRFSIGFGALPGKYHGALRWVYDNYVSAADNNRYDTRNYPHLAISALVHWPLEIPAQNPAGIVPQSYRDEKFGHYVARNGWHADSKQDIILTWFTAKAGGTRSKPWKSLPLVVWGQGRKLEIDLGWKEKRTKELYYETDQTTTLLGFSSGKFALDFSDRSGAEAVLFSTKKLDSGYFGEILHQNVGKITVLTIAKGATHPKAMQVGDAVVVGNLQARMDGDKLIVEDAGANGTDAVVDAFVVKGIDPSLDMVTPATTVHPGTPDHLLSFDLDALEHRDGWLYIDEMVHEKYQAAAFNVRPDHLVSGVFGQGMVFRSGGAVNSVFESIDTEAESKHPFTVRNNERQGIFTSLEIPAESGFDPDAGTRTLSLWMRLPEPRDGYAWIASSDTNSFGIGFHPGPTLMTNGAMAAVTSTFPNDGGIWRHVAYVRDAERKIVTLYIDGVFSARSKLGKVNTYSPMKYYFGGGSKGNSPIGAWAMVDLDVDEIALYNRALTAGEVVALSESRHDPKQSLAYLVAAQRLSDTSGEKPSSDANIPVAVITPSEKVGAPPFAVTFDGSLSFDPQSPNAPNLTYEWDFGDGTTANGAQVSHSYQQLGTYTARLTVADGMGQTSQATHAIKVYNRPPIASIVATDSGESLQLSASNSVDPDGLPLTVSWDLPTGQQAGETITVSDLPAGSHEVALRVRDAGGAESTAYYTVTVPDKNGYRLPENPKDLVPGLHYQYFELFRSEQPIFGRGFPDFYGLEGQRASRFVQRGTIENLNLNNISGGKHKRGFTFGGYVYIPADGEYEFNLQGSTRTAFQIGNDVVVTNSARNLTGHPKIPDETARVKLRQGYHRVSFAQATHILSKAATEHPTWMRLAMRRDDGFAQVIGTGDVFRTPLPAEAAALGTSKTTYGADYLNLGGLLPEKAAPEPANSAPEVTIAVEEVASVLGSKAVRFTVQATDPDGDALSWQWNTGSGHAHENEPVVGRQFVAGDHVVSVIVQDEHGAKTAGIAKVKVPMPAGYGRSINISTSNGGRGWLPPIYPGETAGVLPGNNWISLQRVKGGALRVKYALRNRHDQWVDNTRSTFDGSTEGSYRSRVVTLSEANVGHLVHDRLMATGFDIAADGQVVISGIPYARYDVICYLSGSAGMPAPPVSLLGDVAVDSRPQVNENKKGKKKKKGPGKPQPIVLSVNGQTLNFPAGAANHRWPGYFSELTNDTPEGNVVIVRDLSGPEISIKLSGSLLAGFQIVERK